MLIFDEPTAALADREIDRVKAVVRSLRSAGSSIIYVTHRLDKVFDLADRVTVFRDGRSMHPVATADITLDGLISMMLGGSLAALFPGRGPHQVRLHWRSATFSQSSLPLQSTSTSGRVRSSVSPGNSEAVRAMSSRRSPVIKRRSRGTLRSWVTVPSGSPAAAVRRGIGYSSSNRKRDGLFLQRTVVENLTAPALGDVSRRGRLRRGIERTISDRIAGTFTIDRGRLRSLAGALSGGNQQKVAVGKWTTHGRECSHRQTDTWCRHRSQGRNLRTPTFPRRSRHGHRDRLVRLSGGARHLRHRRHVLQGHPSERAAA